MFFAFSTSPTCTFFSPDAKIAIFYITIIVWKNLPHPWGHLHFSPEGAWESVCNLIRGYLKPQDATDFSILLLFLRESFQNNLSWHWTSPNSFRPCHRFYWCFFWGIDALLIKFMVFKIRYSLFLKRSRGSAASFSCCWRETRPGGS